MVYEMTKSSISASISVENAEIAKVVLMPGDPLRAKFVAENYLEDPVCFNTVRNMLGYTGTYQGKKISVMGSGMGIPSMGIYATELYNQFGVEAIIRIGSAGGLGEDVHVRDVVIAMAGLLQLQLRRRLRPARPPDRRRGLRYALRRRGGGQASPGAGEGGTGLHQRPLLLP